MIVTSLFNLLTSSLLLTTAIAVPILSLLVYNRVVLGQILGQI